MLARGCGACPAVSDGVARCCGWRRASPCGRLRGRNGLGAPRAGLPSTPSRAAVTRAKAQRATNRAGEPISITNGVGAKRPKTVAARTGSAPARARSNTYGTRRMPRRASPKSPGVGLSRCAKKARGSVQRQLATALSRLPQKAEPMAHVEARWLTANRATCDVRKITSCMALAIRNATMGLSKDSCSASGMESSPVGTNSTPTAAAAPHGTENWAIRTVGVVRIRLRRAGARNQRRAEGCGAGAVPTAQNTFASSVQVGREQIHIHESTNAIV